MIQYSMSYSTYQVYLITLRVPVWTIMQAVLQNVWIIDCHWHFCCRHRDLVDL